LGLIGLSSGSEGYNNAYSGYSRYWSAPL